MSFLRGSTNYVWCTTGVLGKGATGAVFQGVSKHDGEPVAVKTFNQLSHMRPPEVQMREFEVLKKVKHENIVKLLAIEEEQDGKGKVIVMELCTGGSLFNILDDPENAYGLQEDEFLLVLKHLSAGMKHLRDNNLVHRDLKPGNIMKFIADDGSTIYKLTDFGAARELHEDQEFMSLYGTEEYLHPDMYERAVLRKTVGKSFSATVDLWSIGVTLYHVATGNLPFRPYGGRRNKETMYYITTKKASGVIAGTQLAENGAIEWSRDLPRTCQLSVGLAALVTPLLGGLLEVDPHKMWTFDMFFNEVLAVLSKKAVRIFYVNKLAPLSVYTHNSDGYRELQCLVLEQTDIAPTNQVLLFRESALREDSPIPETTPSDPIVLFHRENNNVLLETPDTGMPDAPKFPTFPQHTAVENDASLAKLACSVAHVHKRTVERLATATALVVHSQHTLVQVVTTLLRQVYAKSEHERCVTRCLGQRLQALLACQKTSAALLGRAFPALTEELHRQLHPALDKQIEYGTLNQQLSTLVPAIQQLHQRYIRDQVLTTEWESAKSDVPDISSSPCKAATFVRKLRDSWQHLLRDKASRTLTYNDEQFHMLEKIKMAKVGGDLRQLVTECRASTGQLAEALADWYKMAQAVFLQAEILEKDIAIYADNQKSFESSLDIVQDEYEHGVCDLQEDLDTTRVSSSNEEVRRRSSIGGSGKKKDLAKSFHSSLKELSDVQEEVWNILKENSELVNQFQKLTLTLVPSDAKRDCS